MFMIVPGLLPAVVDFFQSGSDAVYIVLLNEIGQMHGQVLRFTLQASYGFDVLAQLGDVQ